MNEAIARLRQFRDDRDWKQFHNPKDLSLALSIEASELLELFLWKSPDQADVSKVKLDKIALNEKKYPVSKARGTAKKYTEL